MAKHLHRRTVGAMTIATVLVEIWWLLHGTIITLSQQHLTVTVSVLLVKLPDIQRPKEARFPLTFHISSRNIMHLWEVWIDSTRMLPATDVIFVQRSGGFRSLYLVWKQHCRMHINCTEQDNLGQVVLSGIISVSEDTSYRLTSRSMANQFCVADQLPTSRPTKGFFQTSGMTVLTTGQQRMLPSDDVVTVVGKFVWFARNVMSDCMLLASRTTTLDE